MKKRLLSASMGFFILAILFVEFFCLLAQPAANLGFNVSFNDTSFEIKNVAKTAYPELDKLSSGMEIQFINNLSEDEILNIRKETSEQSYKNYFSTFFNFGDSINIITKSGINVSFTLQKISYWNRIHSLSSFTKLKFFIALYMIISSLVIILFMKTSKTTDPLVFSLYFLALTTANLFDSEFSSPVYSRIATMIMDIGLFSTISCIFAYFSRIFTYAKYKNPFKFLHIVPIALWIIKYTCILIFRMDIIDNPFFKVYSYFVPGCCLIFVFVFIYITFTFPKNITVTFKFFVIGLAFAVIPLLIDHYGFVLSGSLIMTDKSKILSIIAFFFIPFMLELAVMQYLNLIRSRIAVWITTYVAFSVISLPIWFTLLNFLPTRIHNILSTVYLLGSPFAFILIFAIIRKFFSFDNGENDKRIKTFTSKLEPISDVNNLHICTAVEIQKALDCSYILFFKKEDDNNFVQVFKWGQEYPEENEKQIQNSFSKKRVFLYKDGSFSVPIMRDNTPSGCIYIGPKINNDIYLPGEHAYIEKIAKAFHKHYLLITNNFLFNELKEQSARVQQIQNNTILSLANLIESRDGGTGAHVRRTAEYSILIAKAAKEKGVYADLINDDFIRLIYKAAPMHDIGKIVVPDNILKKPGRFTPEEFALMKLHTTEGERIVKEVLSASEDEDYIRVTSLVAMYHHEKWDGTGYPQGLKSTEIPLFARILAIADVFDALVSPRCYKEPMDPDKAFEIIRKDAGTHFDPELAMIFLGLRNEALEIMRKFI